MYNIIGRGDPWRAPAAASCGGVFEGSRNAPGLVAADLPAVAPPAPVKESGNKQARSSAA
jgi:hypothetical protein